MKPLVGLFIPRPGAPNGELVCASDDPEMVAKVAALFAASGDYVAAEYLARCVARDTRDGELRERSRK